MAGDAVKGGRGWLGFAGTLMLVSGAFMVIEGTAAISGSTVYVENAKFIFADLNFWGWVFLFFGAFKVLIGAGIFTRNTVAVAAGIILAALSAMSQLLAATRYPLWALAVLAIDVLVIYGLYNYGLDDD